MNEGIRFVEAFASPGLNLEGLERLGVSLE